MTHTHTAWKRLTLTAVMAAAAMPLCASIPRRAANTFDAAEPPSHAAGETEKRTDRARADASKIQRMASDRGW